MLTGLGVGEFAGPRGVIMKSFFAAVFVLLFLQPVFGLEVVTLHPLLADWARQVGGEEVTVVNLAEPGTDLHGFSPNPEDLRAMGSAKVILASGKGLEPYLDGLRDALKTGQKIVEVGETLPSLGFEEEEDHDHHEGHDHGTVDPHWWHDAGNARRAVKVIAKAFSEAEPDHAEVFKANAREADGKLRDLDEWVKSQVATIPENQRVLITAHAAMAYFCKAYGFEAGWLQGLSRDGEISSRELADTIRALKETGVRGVFPEAKANPKVLEQLAEGTGAKIGKPLQLDGMAETYEKLMRENVERIVEGLK